MNIFMCAHIPRPVHHIKFSAIASIGVALKRLLCSMVFVLIVAAPHVHADPSGYALAGLEAFDAEMTALMKKWNMPGGSLVVAKDGRLLLAHGYGVANRETGELVQPTHLFRLASLAKTITAVAILQLVENGRLGLDDKVLPILGEIGPRPEVISDPRVHNITIRQLLQHSAGFDEAVRGDPLVMPRIAAAAGRQGGPFPPTCQTVLRDTLELRLQFAPGTRYAYSNLGYCILGRVVERITGTTFEHYVREKILGQVGANGMRLSRTLESGDGEVAYYDYARAPLVLAVPGYGRTMTSRPYGMVPFEALDSVVGWSGTPVDYLRFVLAIDGQRGRPLLSKATFRTQLDSHLPIKKEGDTILYGLGMYVRSVSNLTYWWHDGSQPGTISLYVRRSDGYSWVVVFNSRPANAKIIEFLDEVGGVLWKATDKVRSWPNGDLFPKFP